MKRSFFKKTLLATVSLLFLHGCSAKGDVEEPVGAYLDEKYGVKDFSIISAEKGWFETNDYDVYIEIQKPYRTISYIKLYESKEVNEDYSYYIFEDIVKGAYIEQFPKVIDVTESLVDKYKLLDWNPMTDNEDNQNFYYYIKVNLEEQQREKLIEDFKKNQVLEMKKLLPTLKQGESFDNLGVVNFIFYYNTIDQSGDIPNAQNLVEDLQNSGVLTEGLYQVAIQMIEVTDDGSYSWQEDDRNTKVLFQVDDAGQFAVLGD